MVIEKFIEKVANIAVEHDVDPGDHAGGSGHLSYVSFSIKSILHRYIDEYTIEIDCSFEKEILTEFTVEPYNPPYKYEYTKKIKVYLTTGSLVEVSNQQDLQERVLHYISDYLFRIEQKYGDCRAPIKYPPYFHSEPENTNNIHHLSFIDVDLGENETLVFVSHQTTAMLERIKQVLEERFGEDA